MKENTLTITIRRPLQEVFDFTLDPNNTPKWIHSLVSEERTSDDVAIGTEYRNKNQEGKWSTYVVTEYQPPKKFVMTSGDKNYHVRYAFKELGPQETEFEYREWVDTGELEGPFEIAVLEGLKKVIERER